jgi:hypothetical protein
MKLQFVAGRFRPASPATRMAGPFGSRTAFSAAFMRDLAETWAEYGKDTIRPTLWLSAESRRRPVFPPEAFVELHQCRSRHRLDSAVDKIEVTNDRAVLICSQVELIAVWRKPEPVL